MHRTLIKIVVAGFTVTGLAACSTSGGSSTSGASETSMTSQSDTRQRLSRAEVMSAYSGKTARGSGHSTTYNADGTWKNNSGATGTWSVTGDGTLVMSGDMDLRLQVFREGNRYYHRNASSGAGGYYRIG